MAAWHSAQTTVVAPAEAAAAAELAGSAATAAEEATVADDSVMQSGWIAKVAESGLVGGVSEASLGAAAEAAAAAATAAAESAAAGGDQRQAALLESWKGYKRQFQQGVALFNQKPKKGVAYMQEQGLVGPTPADVAVFLARTQGLK